MCIHIHDISIYSLCHVQSLSIVVHAACRWYKSEINSGVVKGAYGFWTNWWVLDESWWIRCPVWASHSVFSPNIFHFLSFVSTCADGGILRTQRVVDRAMQLHGGLGGQPEQNSRAWGWLYHVFIYFFYSWRFCHVLLIYDVVFSVRRLKLMFQRQIIRRVAIQSGLQHLSVIHIAYQESDIHAGSQDSFLPAAFVGRRPQESKYFELGSGLLLVTACGMMTKSALLLASNWKLS